MTTTITITCQLAQETDKAFGLYDGATHEVLDHATGELTERRHYHWVPKSQARIVKRTRDAALGATVVEIELPEWLAEKSGLMEGRCKRTGDLFK